jgi:hypothetical protein
MRLISLDETDTKPMKAGVSPSHIDAVMKKISEQLGETWTCCRFSGIWLFIQTENDKRVKQHDSRRRNFVQALSDATEASVSVSISF